MRNALHIAGLTATPRLIEALAGQAIAAPTAIQQVAIPAILTRQDVLVTSSTGTGKTLAYLLPLLQRAAAEPTYRVVVLAPSPELALQILNVVQAYREPHVGAVGLVGGGNIDRQKDRLKKHPQVMVGTPGRVLELIVARKVKTAQIGTLVLDEADAMLSPAIAAKLAEICSRPEFTAQVICASASLGPQTQAFMQGLQRPAPLPARAGATPLSSSITHAVVPVDKADKEARLIHLLGHPAVTRALVFVNKLYAVGQLYGLLNEAGCATLGLSAERGKQSRAEALGGLRTGAIRAVVATDTAARGLDVTGLDWVIHYDLARDAETYLHRAGRTGRAGRPGHSVSLMTPRDAPLLEGYGKTLAFALQPLEID